MNEHFDHRGRPRVVVTGVGLQTPAGVGLEKFWSTLLEGRSVAATIKRFDASPLSVRFGCEINDFDPVPYLGPKESRRVDRAAQLGYAASADALADAGDPGVDPARGGVIAGTGIGGLITLEEQVKVYIEKGPDRVSPFFVPMMMANATAGIIGIHLGWMGPNLCITTACAAGANAIGEGTRLIREGLADAVMAGGTECAITPPAVAAFARMGALSKRNDEPELASRPFDADRDGFVMGEGAGMVVLERADRAAARGARIYGEVAGYGTNSDAFHITAPSQGGAGAAACMQLAIDDAGLTAADIGHVNAHGTSTDLNDSAEAEAIRKVFGDSPPPVTSTKGVTGHLVGAAGAIEAIAALQGARTGIVPPTANHHRLGDDIPEIDVVHGEPRSIPVAAALSNSFGFGGHNAALGAGSCSLMLLDGKRILVSGVLNDASIGFGVAKLAQEQGAEVVLSSFGRVMSLTQRTARKLPTAPEIVQLDVTNTEDLDALPERVGGRLDGVLHAIAFAPESCLGGGFLEAPWEDVAIAFQVSAYSLAALARAALPLMSEGGSIVGMDFDNQRQAWPVYDWMGVAKSAFESTARYLARELGPRGVRVNLVSAGPVRTLAARSIPGFEQFEAVWSERAPLGWDIRDNQPIAQAAVALLSDWFPATTGEMLHVDGGFHAIGV